MADNSNDDKWRDKYRQSLDNNEKLQNTIELLKKCVVRVSLAADGIDHKLNSQLADLRNLIKKDASDAEIELKIDNLSEIVRNLEDSSKTSNNPLFDNFHNLVKPLQEASISNNLSKKIQSLVRRIKKSPEKISTEELISNYSEIIAEAIGLSTDNLDNLDYEIGPDKPGLFQRVFSKEKEQNEENQDEDGISKISDNIKDILLNLLEHLILPDTYKNRAKEIKMDLKMGLTITKLPETLDNIVSLVVDSTSEETHEFEDFLQAVADQLSELHKYLSSIGIAANEYSVDSENLGDAVKNQIEKIQSGIIESNDLSSLKNNIQSQLSSIVENVDDFCTAQAEKNNETKAKIEILKTRLEETEEESAMLRERLVIQRAHAQLDPLTKLPNRQAYDHQLNSEFSRWQRYHKSLTLIIADIDFFKKINDTFGHAAGDKVLKTVARVLQVNLRETDFIARFGGEEFVIIMPETAQEDAVRVADKLRTTVSDCPFHSSNEKVPVTLSFGVCEFKEGDTCESVFDKADKALYKAKENGRNRVEQHK